MSSAIERMTFGAGRAEATQRRPGMPTFHTILACTDGSKQAARALEWARDMAKLHRARVVVASVFSPPILDQGLATAYGVYPGMGGAWAAAEDELRKAARSSAAELRAGGVEAESVVAMGSTPHELAEIARTHHADLVILGSHGRGLVERALMGSTADALVDRVDSSVLIARTPPRPSQILAATDGSHASFRAVAYALRHAEATGASVAVQHVLEYPGASEDVPSAGYLRDVIGRMKLETPPRVSYHLDAGRPADRILAKADELDAGLIVIGSRGLGRVRGALLGSVSRRVVHGARASVLVVKDAHR